jgi:hypothetical protein
MSQQHEEEGTKSGRPLSSSYALDHVAFAAWDIGQVVPFFEDELGAKVDNGVMGLTFDVVQWYAGNSKLEVLQPPLSLATDEERLKKNFLYRFLATTGPTVHHVTITVPNIELAIADAKRLGFEVVGVELKRFAPTWKEAFIHPKQPGIGVVVQIAEAHPELRNPVAQQLWEDQSFLYQLGSHGRRPTFEPYVKLESLRLVVRNKADAFRLWVDLLHATPIQHSDNLFEFKWPTSGSSILVEVDSTAVVEGPQCVELRQLKPWDKVPVTLTLCHSQMDDKLELPLPHPIMGIPFRVHPLKVVDKALKAAL